jgi:hypothetical protein
VFEGPFVVRHRKKHVRVELVSYGVSASGPARPSSAVWTVAVDGVSCHAFAGGPDDTRASVAAQVHAWFTEHPELFNL